MRVNLTGVLENLSKVAGAEERREAAKEQLKPQLEPATMKIIESISGPIHMSDVDVQLDGTGGDSLSVTAWKRVGGLRLAPVSIKIGQIDNPEAAEAFVEEVDTRKEDSSHIGKFFGPLDYWFGWLGIGILMFLLLRWPGRKG
jgi:hypothetical protein